MSSLSSASATAGGTETVERLLRRCSSNLKSFSDGLSDTKKSVLGLTDFHKLLKDPKTAILRLCARSGIAVRKILERARETSPAARCHHGVAACIDLGGPSGLRCGAGADGLAELRHLALRVVQRQFVRGVEGVGFVLRH